VSSLWAVDDAATRDLMVTFYSLLEEGLSKGEALRAAQAAVRKAYPGPFYWAAFVLSGDPGDGLAVDDAELPDLSPGKSGTSTRGTSSTASGSITGLLSKLESAARQAAESWGPAAP
jgi:hypothetical protein